MLGYTRITRREFYDHGGFSNVLHVRVQRGHSWTYWSRTR
jgi:hypothetical protein